MFKLELRYTFRDSNGFKWFAIIKQRGRFHTEKPMYSLQMYPSWAKDKAVYYGCTDLAHARRMLSHQAKKIKVG